jgi:phospholipase/carboxylesterase
MGREAHDLMQAAGHHTRWYEYPMAHEVCMDEIADIRRWLAERFGL